MLAEKNYSVSVLQIFLPIDSKVTPSAAANLLKGGGDGQTEETIKRRTGLKGRLCYISQEFGVSPKKNLGRGKSRLH